MNKSKIIVKVTASFADDAQLFRMLKKYARHSDDVFAWWDEFAFTTSAIAEADALLVFNDPRDPVSLLSDPSKLIAFMMEPGVPTEHPWMFKGLGRYSRVYSPLANAPNVVPSHGFLGWYFDHDLTFLEQMPVPEKTRNLSCIASTLKQLKGHRLRTGFVERLSREIQGVDMFGKGRYYLADKLDGLLPYRYSVAIENASMPDYFTEKINDCFLAYTVPFYFGCTNIGKYFPEGSFVWIDITRPDKAIHKIAETVMSSDWQQRLPALLEAREKVLNAYQPLAGAASILRDMTSGGTKQIVSLHPTKAATWTKIKRMIRGG